MSYIQLPYGYVKNNKQVQFNLPNNYEESFYLKQAPYLTNQNPAVENNLINLIRNRDDFKKWLLATSKCGDKIQEDLNAIVGYDEIFTNAIVRHSLDLKNEAIFRNPNPINLTFHDMKKFDLVNPVVGKLASQVKASKLRDYELTKKILQKVEVDELQLRLNKLKYGIPKDDDDDTKPGSGGGSRGTPGPGPPRPRDFPPLSKHIVAKNLQPLNQSRGTSFLSPEGSCSSLRNKLPNIAPLPSRLSIDNFSRPVTEITDEKNNTISITPKKKVVRPIGQRQLSQQLQKVFLMSIVPLKKHLKLLKNEVKT